MFKCNCGGDLKVTNTYTMEDNVTYRRRVCNNCKKTIFTVEKTTNDRIVITKNCVPVLEKGE